MYYPINVILSLLLTSSFFFFFFFCRGNIIYYIISSSWESKIPGVLCIYRNKYIDIDISISSFFSRVCVCVVQCNIIRLACLCPILSYLSCQSVSLSISQSVSQSVYLSVYSASSVSGLDKGGARTTISAPMVKRPATGPVYPPKSVSLEAIIRLLATS